MAEHAPVTYDDLFVYAPSYGLWEASRVAGQLFEGKSLGTAKEHDLVFLQKDRSMDFLLKPEQYAKERESGRKSGRKKLVDTQAAVEPVLNRIVGWYQSKKIDEAEFRKQMTTTMKKAWKDVFEAGVRASGVLGKNGDVATNLGPDDEVWIRSAMKHEMQFLNGMLDAIVDETYVMPLPRRIHMYVDALSSFYDSARVIGLPAMSAISWITPKKDGKVCASCEYLAAHSPYSKKTLPTVPRSGATICLTNCRDRLLVRVIEPAEAVKLHQSSPTRATHIKKLRKIKQLGHL